MATVGDPIMDLGCTLGYWVEKNDTAEFKLIRTLPTHVEGAMTRMEVVAYYEKLSGKSIENMNAQGRLIEPEEVSAVALLLAQDVSKGITGQAINVDGGTVMW